MAFAEPPPPLPPPHIPRVGPDGKPSRAWVDYETAFAAWLKRLAAAIP